LLYDIEIMYLKTIKYAFSLFYILIKHGFSNNQLRAQGPIYFFLVLFYANAL